MLHLETGNPPYYIAPIVEQYRKLEPESEEARSLSRIIAANIGDYASLRLVLGIDPPEFGRFYPDMEVNTPSTLDTIDSFLDKFGTSIPAPEILQQPREDEISAEESGSNPASLSSLVRQRKYKKAIELIETQNLNNPQKSIYFAHQIRFLRKLMAIENYRTKTTD